MILYKTYTRKQSVWSGNVRKGKTVQYGLTYEEAKEACEKFNAARTKFELRKGLRMEFTEQRSKRNA